MLNEIKVPDLGDGIDGGDVINILVKKGDSIQKDDPMFELETDKATVDVPSPVAGVVEKVLINNGDHVTVGQVVLQVSGAFENEKTKSQLSAAEPKQEAPSTTPPPASAQPAPPEAKTKLPVSVPDMGDGVAEADVISVLVKVGDKIKRGDSLVEVETDKATVEIPSDKSGKVISVSVKAGDKIQPGNIILELETTTTAVTETEAIAVSAVQASEPPTLAGTTEFPSTTKKAVNPEGFKPSSYDKPKKLIPAAPSVRRFAREIGIDLAEVPGTGARNRITKEDVKAFSKTLNENRKSPPTTLGTGVTAQSLPDFSKWGQVERVTMTKIRRLTAESMAHAWNVIPHVTQFDKADVTQLEALRQKYKQRVEQDGGKLTLTAVLIKVLALALKKHPNFNVSVDMHSNEIIQKYYYHIGVAVATPNGLMVPVIQNADQKNITQLATDLNDISTRARDRKIRPDELQGGCMTITNLGGIAGTAFTPILNWPEAAILGVSKSSMEQVYRSGEFQAALMMPLSLSYDHRVIDGVDAAVFLRDVVEILENPFLLSLEG
ncbi:MAG: 2-oxo acid dehydrogenase subunit E2 [SAR324 cluster bacterium]|nr:2-oxo acid dehydrogenase subunit E2 [SAR324 cluster bacterium]